MTPDHDRSRSPGGRTPLPDLLRGHRLAAGLTQAELATRAGVGVRTVRDLERGRATRPQRTTVDLLADALGLTGPARQAFLAAARPAQAAPPADAPQPPVGGPDAADAPRPPARHLAVTGSAGTDSGTPIALPQPVPLLGRDRDVAEVTALLAEHPVVSLVGLAGVGKTALALTVAYAAATDHPAGVTGVLVGEGSDAADVLAASVAVLGVNRLADLSCRLGGQPALLLVDAVERAPGPVAEALRTLVAAAPTLRVLVTGRRPAGVPGELVRPVAPLDVPPAGLEPADPAELARWPAATLFLARLARARREPPTPAELPALAALVRRLGGLPLAIELMAARGRILDVTELLDRYGDRVLDLAGVRPGWEPADPAAGTVTLREAVATSYHLLAPAERAALRRLSAFRNRWSVELAEDLLADGGERRDAVPLLDRLRELGLLSVRGTGPFRFRLLDAVRDFATEQAAVEGELTAIRRRHALVVAGLVRRTAPGLVGADVPTAVHLLDEATSDITAALAHAAEDDPATALLLAAALPRWWRLRGRDVSGRRWLRRLLADPRTAGAPPVLRAWALLGSARLAAEHGAGGGELPAVRDALEIFRAAGEVTGELSARSVLCALLSSAGAHREAREQAEAALEVATRHGRVREMAVAHQHLTWHDVRVADLTGARRRLATVDRLATQSGEQRLRLLARADLAEVTRLEGRYVDAVELGRRAADALVELGDPGRWRRVVGTVGLALALEGRVAEALEVVAELRPAHPVPAQRRPPGVEDPAGERRDVSPEEVVCALIEGHLALHRGDRELAAEWFTAAAESAGGGGERRDVVEALVGLAASTGEVAVLDRLDRACRATGIRLLPREEALLYALVARRERAVRGN
ncbi:helix-turn-helix domain-containing protein [Micromonospora terminaliae]|uniref:Helix-turn-helix domain-containing protein n=1 Tax=Micromonospora terminaliae TaxID=1914461 RepID=A0AAJ2ZIK2_9ACTN|nr:helix-turn-helix domain-containing protein [Micromonospora terminaliae]NES29663.1 XRE family transcriptional regulator [Micromonospora terminaliae]QGL50144.1 helix-turn-helix domain-containing protein [Micromonospora terminaliae]